MILQNNKIFRITARTVCLILVVCLFVIPVIVLTAPKKVGLGVQTIKNIYTQSLGIGTTGDYTKFNVTNAGVTTIDGNLSVGGTSHNKFTVAAASGNTAIAGTLAVTGTSALTGATTVTGAIQANGGIACETGNVFTVANTTGAVHTSSTLDADGAVTFGANGTEFTVATSGNTAIAGTLGVSGATRLAVLSTVAETTDTRVCTSADYGKTIMCSYAGAVAVTLPANGAAAGSWIRVMNLNSDTTAVTVSPATADTLITPNSVDSDSITYGSGHRIGSSTLFISNGTKWAAINESVGCTMSVTDTD